MESLKVRRICDSQPARGECLAPAVKISYRRPWTYWLQGKNHDADYHRCNFSNAIGGGGRGRGWKVLKVPSKPCWNRISLHFRPNFLSSLVGGRSRGDIKFVPAVYPPLVDTFLGILRLTRRCEHIWTSEQWPTLSVLFPVGLVWRRHGRVCRSASESAGMTSSAIENRPRRSRPVWPAAWPRTGVSARAPGLHERAPCPTTRTSPRMYRDEILRCWYGDKRGRDFLRFPSAHFFFIGRDSATGECRPQS